MVYHYDRTCDGATYNHRMLLDLVSAQGNALRSETVLSLYEAGDGTMMRFHVRELVNGNVATELQGKVERPAVGQPAKVVYETRSGAEGDAPVVLPANVLFPLQHTDDLILAALAGAVTHNARTFDGDALAQVDSFIRPTESGSAGDLLPREMEGMKSWITRVSFFRAGSGDAAPYYETQLQFWENGLTGDFTMETDDLAIQARLSEVEFYDKPVCD
jgi:hypothetical protein